MLIKYNLASCLTKIPASKQFRVKSLDNCMNFLLHLQITRELGPMKYTLNGFVIQIQKLGIEKFQFSSITQSYPTLSHLMDCSTPGFPVRYKLPELTQSHVHSVGDANQLSHPLSFPSPPAFNLFQHQGLYYESALHNRWPK